MKVSAKVSGRVQSEVSADDAEIISASKPNRKKKLPSSGRYLVRNGNSLLLQIRMPKGLVSKGNGLLRLSLGAMPIAKARAMPIAKARAMLTNSPESPEEPFVIWREL